MNSNIIFVMPPQGTSGAVPLEFLLQKYPVFDKFYSQTESYFLTQGYSKEEIFYNFSNPNESSAISSHPFIYFWSVAMASLYIEFGILPNAILGHSLGEFAALTVAFDTDYTDMLHFVTQRAKMLDEISQRHNKGAMCHVLLPSTELENIIAPLKNISIASINSANSCVASGDSNEIILLEKICDKQQIPHKRLRVPHAAHSPMLRDIDFSSLPFPKIKKKEKKIFPFSPFFSVFLSSGIDIEHFNMENYPNFQAKNIANFYSAFSKMQESHKNPICIEFSVHSTLKSACLAKGATEHIGASALPCYVPNLSREECFYQAIENNLAKLRRLNQ